ncbi:hypothetical protein [Brevibacillus borstelensis]
MSDGKQANRNLILTGNSRQRQPAKAQGGLAGNWLRRKRKATSQH